MKKIDNRVALKVRVSAQEKQALKTYTQTNDTTIQRLLHEYIKKILKEERN
uniref:hypothetical protein n=1 Tax=Eubacterium sp. TaxID=142586 RepID=UPI00402A1CC8